MAEVLYVKVTRNPLLKRPLIITPLQLFISPKRRAYIFIVFLCTKIRDLLYYYYLLTSNISFPGHC
jgi:hypothetical protein